MISQAAARLLRTLIHALHSKPPPDSAYLPAPPWTGLHLRPRRPARCDRGYTSPYPTPVASHNPPPYRR